MKPLRYLRHDRILLRMKSTRKVEAIRELAEQLSGAVEIPDLRRFVSAILQKESRFGSGVGRGVALPHYRDDSVQEPVVCIGLSEPGIAWDDGETVHILVLIGWPLKHDQAYLKTVADLARVLHLQPVREQILAAGDGAEVLEILKSEGAPSEQVSC
jgi:mannitol/fructose-specific phosphotransferase system IIA component (Ntr-type)